MKFKDLVQKGTAYKEALALDAILSSRYRRLLLRFFAILSVASFAASFIDFVDDSHNSLPDGLFFLFFFASILLFLLQTFYNSFKFYEDATRVPLTWSVAEIVYKTDDLDITLGFVESTLGATLLKRLGADSKSVTLFKESDRERLLGANFEIESDFVDFAEYAIAVYTADKSLSAFLSSRNVSRDEYEGAAHWIENNTERQMKKDRWWGRDNLDSLPSLGTSLAYGNAYELSKYARSVLNDSFTKEIDLEHGYRSREITQIENAFIRSNEANAILIDNDETVARDIVVRFAEKIRLGRTPPSLEHKTVLELDWTRLTADLKSKAELEVEFLKILNECAAAGNIIVYIPNLPSFMAECKKVGMNLSSVMEKYLVSPQINILAHSIKTDFYYFIEVNPSLGRIFERIVPDEKGAKSSMPALLERISHIESAYKNRLYFTYPAISEVAELADRLIPYGEMPTKAIDLVFELAPWAVSNGIAILTKADVDTFISTKTGVATGGISESEGEKLALLEELLHERIVGQNEAVNAVSSGIRRGRSGVGNPKRPISTLLFLGPTGVGKTETAKALAESYFGAEDRMVRFDMSEFNGADGMPRLIGSVSEGVVGSLATKLREMPYGVMLLDEFEKAAPDVLNLFLRILDEGKFTDALGGEVSARNNIIIATSNAGSELIWDAVRNRKDLEKEKPAIIDYLIDKHIFKPELINRFDAVVVFKPLENMELRSIAEKMLNKFIEHIKSEKQIDLKVSPELVDYLVLHGADREFGARSIRRVMQEKLEDTLAKKIISGSAKAGSTIEIGVKDVI